VAEVVGNQGRDLGQDRDYRDPGFQENEELVVDHHVPVRDRNRLQEMHRQKFLPM
jgi:hypothetical protein